MKGQMFGRYVFSILVVLLGVVFEYLGVGREFLGFSSVGTWLVYVGFIMIAVVTLQLISNKKRIVDERMKSISFKASRVTFVLIIFAAFAIMIIDGIHSIDVPYHLFMSYIIAYMMLIYFVAYKILEKYN